MNEHNNDSQASCPISAHQAKYFAHELTSRKAGMEGLGEALLNAKVDLNPHQIEAAVFALKNPLQQGVLLADEVGLGKTIEAALVLCQLWAEEKRKLLIICPASLRQQWEQELRDKFALPSLVVDKTVIRRQKVSLPQFFNQHIGKQILIMSYQFAAQNAGLLQATDWHLLVIDEAHKLRNAHRKTNRNGQILRKAFAGNKKILLSATPLQSFVKPMHREQTAPN